jgi:hypothetical protein
MAGVVTVRLIQEKVSVSRIAKWHTRKYKFK